MNILVYGAGVIGSLYAARLKEAGQEVSVLARGQRSADIREHGIVLEHALSGERSVTRVNVVDELTPEPVYDLIVVVMRKNQVSAILPILEANRATPNILFMVNTASGYSAWEEAVGGERVLVGFPGAGGTRQGHVVRYAVTSRRMQPTTLGEVDGRRTARLREIADMFERAGFPVAVSRNMDAWQKTHVAMVTPMANALYMAGGDNYRLACMPDAGRLMVRAVREGFQVLKALGIPITPSKLRLWEWMPESILAALMLRWANTKQFEIVAARHANAARDEMQQLAEEFEELAKMTSVPTPATDELNRYNPPVRPVAKPLAR